MLKLSEWVLSVVVGKSVTGNRHNTVVDRNNNSALGKELVRSGLSPSLVNNYRVGGGGVDCTQIEVALFNDLVCARHGRLEIYALERVSKVLVAPCDWLHVSVDNEWLIINVLLTQVWNEKVERGYCAVANNTLLARYLVDSVVIPPRLNETVTGNSGPPHCTAEVVAKLLSFRDRLPSLLGSISGTNVLIFCGRGHSYSVRD